MTKTLNISLIKQAVTAAEANQRQTTSHTKTRGNVRGGGRKPWRQKGTGNARAGSRRSPIWVGGGITFGPQKERTFKQALPKKMAQAAFNELLRYLQTEKRLIIADALTVNQAKTKAALELVKKFDVGPGQILLVTATLQPQLILACRNLPHVTVVTNQNLSILDLSAAGTVVMDKAAAGERGLVKPEKPATKIPNKGTK